MPRWGKGRCGGARSTLFAPVGQRRFRVGAPDFGGFTGESALRAVCLSGRAGRRAGGTGGTQSARDGNTRITDENAPFPDRTFCFIRLRRRPSCSPSRDRHIPLPSRGENGGLCPHPPKGPVPWVSLFGEPGHLPRLPVSPNAAGGKSLLVDLPPSVPSPPHQKRKEASMPPARGAWMRRLRANGAGRRHCRHCRPGIILPPPIRARGRRCMRLCPACCQRCR